MFNRRKTFAAIAGFLAIVVCGSLFISQQKSKREAQPAAEQAITGSQVPAANPQKRANFLIGDGDRMMEDGDYVSARSFYEAALKLDPSNAAARAGIKRAEDSMNGKN